MAGSPELAAALRACRTAAGFTQQQLADSAQISIGLVRGVEYGRRGLSHEFYRRLVDALTEHVGDPTLMERLALAQRRMLPTDDVPSQPNPEESLERIVSDNSTWSTLVNAMSVLHGNARYKGDVEAKRFIDFVASLYLIMREGVRVGDKLWDIVPEMRPLRKVFALDAEEFADWCRRQTLSHYRASLAVATACWVDPTLLPALLLFASGPLRAPGRAVIDTLTRVNSGTSDA